MTEPTTLTRVPRSAVPRLRMRHVLAVAGAVGAIILLRFLVPLLEGPSRTDLHVENRTDYDISIAASSPDRALWTPLGTVDAGEKTDFEGVIDQGDEWVFRFTTQGHDGGEVEMSRHDLEADDGKLVIPASVGATLRDDGVPVPR